MGCMPSALQLDLCTLTCMGAVLDQPHDCSCPSAHENGRTILYYLFPLSDGIPGPNVQVSGDEEITSKYCCVHHLTHLRRPQGIRMVLWNEAGGAMGGRHTCTQWSGYHWEARRFNGCCPFHISCGMIPLDTKCWVGGRMFDGVDTFEKPESFAGVAF